MRLEGGQKEGARKVLKMEWELQNEGESNDEGGPKGCIEGQSDGGTRRKQSSRNERARSLGTTPLYWPFQRCLFGGSTGAARSRPVWIITSSKDGGYKVPYTSGIAADARQEWAYEVQPASIFGRKGGETCGKEEGSKMPVREITEKGRKETQRPF